MMELVILTCALCNKVFERRACNAKGALHYCSNACMHNRGPVKIWPATKKHWIGAECMHCKRKYEWFGDLLPVPNYCSMVCKRGAVRQEKVLRECEHCKGYFRIVGAYEGNVKWCSWKCMQDAKGQE